MLLQLITQALEERKPYLSLVADARDDLERFSAAIFVNGSELDTWFFNDPGEFASLFPLMRSTGGRIWFSHLDCSSDDLTEDALQSALANLGVK